VWGGGFDRQVKKLADRQGRPKKNYNRVTVTAGDLELNMILEIIMGSLGRMRRFV
jgi:hypothetical protein